jgi:hypothetical protein
MLSRNRAVFARTLIQGHSGEDVRQLQDMLRRAGFDPGPSDGNFGRSTHDAVVAFQRSQGLDPDGAVGPITTAALTRVATQSGAASGTPAQGISLHIGLNRVDNAAYGFQVPDLAGCINDANDMQQLAIGKGFRTRQLLDNQATSAAIVSAIEQAAQILNPGDLFWISYSGHGSQVPDPLEPDLRSETWVLWDRQLIDDELYALWSRFKAGVRILLISDSCHSGTVSRQFALLNAAVSEMMRGVRQRGQRAVEGAVLARVEDMVRDAARQFVPLAAGTTRDLGPVADQPRLLDERLGFRDAADRAALYREEVTRNAVASAPACKVLLISGCQDNQTSSDGRPDPSGHQNGAFTKALRNVWETSTDYADLHARILQQMPSTQTPNLFWATDRDPAFEAQRPFSILDGGARVLDAADAPTAAGYAPQSRDLETTHPY